MPLDPQIQQHYSAQKALASASGTPSLAQIRENADKVYNDKESFPVVFSVKDYKIKNNEGEIPVRVYKSNDNNNSPVLLYFHGGGFMMHNIASHDSLCRQLCNKCESTVVNVGYRLAPEYPYPNYMNDSYAALEWVYSNANELGIDNTKIAVCGDSAGGQISEALCLMSRDKNGPKIGLQIPCYAPAGVYGIESESMQAFGDGNYVLSKDFLEMCLKSIDPEGKYANDPYMMPGTAKDLSNLPKAYVVTAEYDPLRDDGEAYAELLKKAGNDVTLYRVPGATHGFLLLWKKFDISKHVIDCIAKVFKETFN